MSSLKTRSKFGIKLKKFKIFASSLAIGSAFLCSSYARSKPAYSIHEARIAGTPKIPRTPGIRTLSLKEMEIGTVTIHPDGSVINFPGKPQIHVGKKGSFEIAYVENDLVISCRTPGSKANLFIYLGGRRYTLKIQFNGTGGDQIVSVRDPLDSSIDAEAFHD
ncbi:MAG: hypothetical protein NT027_07415 [Proteobacteria bacterium]|nr:hypothetical protein [Pseudomonadota bacterium]